MPDSIAIGTITTTNPTLWVDPTSLGGDPAKYEIASASAGPYTFEVNQFCAVLSVRWLQARANGPVKPPYGIATFNDDVKKAMAEQLITFSSMEDQENYAAQQLGGGVTDRSTIIKGMAPNTATSYHLGTRIWAGTIAHVVAYYVTSPTQYEMYDSNDGSIATYDRSKFQTACSAFVVKSA